MYACSSPQYSLCEATYRVIAITFSFFLLFPSSFLSFSLSFLTYPCLLHHLKQVDSPYSICLFSCISRNIYLLPLCVPGIWVNCTIISICTRYVPGQHYYMNRYHFLVVLPLFTPLARKSRQLDGLDSSHCTRRPAVRMIM